MLDQSQNVVVERSVALAKKLFTSIVFVMYVNGDIVPMLRVNSIHLPDQQYRYVSDQSIRIFLDECCFEIWWAKGRDRPDRIEYRGPVSFGAEINSISVDTVDTVDLTDQKLDYLFGMLEAS